MRFALVLLLLAGDVARARDDRAARRGAGDDVSHQVCRSRRRRSMPSGCRPMSNSCWPRSTGRCRRIGPTRRSADSIARRPASGSLSRRATAEVAAAARAISEKTGGAMDVTVGPLVRLWHFGPPQKNGDKSKTKFAPPTDEQLSAARKRVGYKQLDVRLEPPALRKQVDGLEVDLSSIASGYTIDQLAELLLDSRHHELHGRAWRRSSGRRQSRGRHAVARRDRAADRRTNAKWKSPCRW